MSPIYTIFDIDGGIGISEALSISNLQDSVFLCEWNSSALVGLGHDKIVKLSSQQLKHKDLVFLGPNLYKR